MEANHRRSGGVKMKRPRKVKCDQCVIAVINGVVCHEHGCPNAKKTRRFRLVIGDNVFRVLPPEGGWYPH